MKRIFLTSLLIAGLAGIVSAHDGVVHKGTEGQIVSVGTDRFELKTAKETIPVTFSSKTKFEHDKKAVDKSHLTKGAQVTVVGTKLPSGEMVAKEVVIGKMDAHGGDHTKTSHVPQPAHHK